MVSSNHRKSIACCRIGLLQSTDEQWPCCFVSEISLSLSLTCVPPLQIIGWNGIGRLGKSQTSTPYLQTYSASLLLPWISFPLFCLFTFISHLSLLTPLYSLFRLHSYHALFYCHRCLIAFFLLRVTQPMHDN